MNFFFSVVVPVYNTERYLPRCLDSLISQTFCKDNLQVVLVNDASPNFNLCDDIVCMYNQKLNITYLRLEENKGTHFARKTGIEKVEGEYVLFLDSDDYLEKKALSLLYKDIHKYGDADYIEFNMNQLRWNIFKLKDTFLKPRDSKVNIIDVFDNDGGHQRGVVHKCFKASFAKPIYKNMAEDYILHTEDFYEMCVLDFFAKNRRILKDYIYVYVIGTGITSQEIYYGEKLKKIILSISNIDKHLVDFYVQHGATDYSKLVKQHSIDSLLWFMEHSNIKEFVEYSKEVLDDRLLEIIIFEYLAKTASIVKSSKKKGRLSLFIAKTIRYLKRRFR